MIHDTIAANTCKKTMPGSSMTEPFPVARQYAADFTIPRLSLTAEEFRRQFLLPNHPVVLGEEITRNWRARKEWVIRTDSSDDGHAHAGSPEELRPNFEFLRRFSDATVDVADCKGKQYDAQPKQQMKFGDYLDYLEECAQDHVTSALNDTTNHGNNLLYLKDWHFVRQFPDYQAYTTPEHFCDDWLNENSDFKEQDDFRFVYIGPHGSFTPLHTDVLGSHSWSANIVGIKDWYMIAPDDIPFLEDVHGRDKVHDIFDVDKDKFPNFTKVRVIHVRQYPGEIMFVPSFWYHQVHNVETTVSINHNWFNAANIDLASWSLFLDLHKVYRALEGIFDDKEEEKDHAQIVLRAQAGMNLHEWVDFLRFFERLYMEGKKGNDERTRTWALERIRQCIDETLSRIK